jgi:hypothetical protein
MVNYLYKITMILLLPLYSYCQKANPTNSQKANPTKKETFDFIVYQCKFFDNPGYYPKQELAGANYENLTLQVMDFVPNNIFYRSIKSTLNLYDISDVKFHQDNSDPKNIIYELTIYFKLPYPSIRYDKKGDGQFETTDISETFYFSSKGEARKMYKAILHMQSLVGVKKQLFSGD